MRQTGQQRLCQILRVLRNRGRIDPTSRSIVRQRIRNDGDDDLSIASEKGIVELIVVIACTGETGCRVGGGTPGFSCRRCGGNGPALNERPFKGALGEEILASVCQACWKEWVGMGTKVINELRLPMFDPQAQEVYDKHMKEFLMLT